MAGARWDHITALHSGRPFRAGLTRPRCPLLGRGVLSANPFTQRLVWLNVGLRALMELALVWALAVWGYGLAAGSWLGAALAVIAPGVGFGIWGLVDFRFAGRWAEVLRLVEELVISALAALAAISAISADHSILGWSLATLTIVHHALVYVTGERLLKPLVRRTAGRRSDHDE